MQEMWDQSLGQEDPLEKEMAILFQYSCLENPMDRGATAHGVAKTQTQWSNLTTKNSRESLGYRLLVRSMNF